MLRSMYSGISGLRGFQTKLDVIGNNIANVNTFGFKKGRVTFKDMISQQVQGASSPQQNRGGTNPRQVGLGSQLSSIDTIHTPGSAQPTSRPLDLAISGEGFFIVNDGDLSYYSRAGNFYLDHHGNLVNADGLYVQGYAADEEGNIDRTALSNLRIASGSAIAPNPTSEIDLKGNLHVGTKVGNAFEDGDEVTERTLREAENNVILPIKVVDSIGGTHELTVIAQKTGAAEWKFGYLLPVEQEEEGDEGSADFTYHEINGDSLLFKSNGTVETDDEENPDAWQSASITINPNALTPGYEGNADNLTIEIDFSQLTQFGSSHSLEVDRINGNTEGFLEGFDVSQSGEIFGIYTNGNVQALGQIALASFSNPEGLTKAGNNLYQVSNNSGIASIGIPGEDAGTIIGGSLEMSNVDLAEEFTEMIVAQRGFQANTRIITTSDEILQELVNLKR